MIEIATIPPSEQSEAHVERLPLLQCKDGTSVTQSTDWPERRSEIEADWLDYLGPSPFPDLEPKVRTEPEEEMAGGTGQRVWLRTAPGYDELCYLMRPSEGVPPVKRPAVIVFYYDIDIPAGRSSSRRPNSGPGARDFALRLMQQGYVTLVQRWFCEGYRPPDQSQVASLSERYRQSVSRFMAETPQCKPMRRVIADASRCVDYLQSLPFVDESRIGCMGHSLGGKMALYAGAFDSRFAVTVGSELGIGLSFSNWNAPWYLDEQVHNSAFHLDHHQLLALIAPRPFLLVAGDSADGDHSWAYLNSAREVYRLHDNAPALGVANHRSGHTPTPEATESAYHWLDRWL